MKKIILTLVLVPFYAQAMCLSFYYDYNGQSVATRCGGHREEIECGRQDAYWNGQSCQEIDMIKNCKAQGGTWRQVGLKNKPLSVGDVLGNPNNALSRGFRNICICEEPLVWDGEECVSELSSELKGKLIDVWCDSLRKDMKVYIPPHILGYKEIKRTLN